MNNRLYNKILNSINYEIKNTLLEQFNIGNMNLSDNSKRNFNIFNKNTVDPYKIYKNLITHLYIEK